MFCAIRGVDVQKNGATSGKYTFIENEGLPKEMGWKTVKTTDFLWKCRFYWGLSTISWIKWYKSCLAKTQNAEVTINRCYVNLCYNQ